MIPGWVHYLYPLMLLGTGWCVRTDAMHVKCCLAMLMWLVARSASYEYGQIDAIESALTMAVFVGMCFGIWKLHKGAKLPVILAVVGAVMYFWSAAFVNGSPMYGLWDGELQATIWFKGVFNVAFTTGCGIICLNYGWWCLRQRLQ